MYVKMLSRIFRSNTVSKRLFSCGVRDQATIAVHQAHAINELRALNTLLENERFNLMNDTLKLQNKMEYLKSRPDQNYVVQQMIDNVNKQQHVSAIYGQKKIGQILHSIGIVEDRIELLQLSLCSPK